MSMTGNVRAARISRLAAVAGFVIVIVGIGGVHLDGFQPLQAFSFAGAGMAAGGFLATVSALAALLLNRKHADVSVGRRAIASGIVGVVLLAPPVGLMVSARGYPPINDITTDLENPPGLLAPDEEGGLSAVSFPDAFKTPSLEAYGDLQPITVSLGAETAFAKVAAVARELGWSVVAEDPDAGILRARVESRVFRFVDDITVRVIARDRRSVIDVRSRSRDGRSDIGANAARIRQFIAALDGG